jgi:predicted RND superfamily exporter protein
MVDAFGADEVLLVQLRGASYQNEDDLLALARLTRQLSAIEGVTAAFSLANAIDTGQEELPTSLTEAELGDVSAEVEAISVYTELGLVNASTPSLSVLAVTVMDSTQARLALVQSVAEIVGQYETDERRVYVAGLTTTHVAFDRLTRRSLFLFMPAVVLVSLIVGLVLFRSARALVALLAPVLGTVVLGLAGLELAGESLNLVTAVLPPLVLAIGFASALHLITHYSTMTGEGYTPTDAARITIQQKLSPTAFAFGTTAIGFGSLGLSPVHSIRVLGIAASATLVAAIVLVTLGTPALLLWLRPQLRQPTYRRRVLARLAILSVKRRFVVIASSTIVIVFLAGGALRMEDAINGVTLLAPDAPERVAYELLESDGVGLGNLELWIDEQVPTRDALLEESQRLRRLATELESLPSVTGTFSAADIIEVAEHRLERSRENEAEPRPVGDVALFHELTSQSWDRDAGLRVTIMSTTVDRPEQLVAIQEQILVETAALYPESRARITGHYATLIGTPGALGDTLTRSLGLTVFVIFILFIIAFRSLGLALGGMVANLAPVIAALGVMGWAGIPLDVATVMTASVVLGLAVDDTFHYLYHRRKTASIVCAAGIAGQGIVATTFVVSLGFVALTLSGFAPVTRFGLLVSVGAVLALAVDAFLLPALVGRSKELLSACAEDVSIPQRLQKISASQSRLP